MSPITSSEALDAHPVDWPRPAAAWYTTFVLMVAYTLSYVDRQILSLLVGPIKADLLLSDTQFSLLNGLAFALLYAVLGIPLGVLADRYNRRNLIAAGIGLWSVMTAISGLATGYALLFAARVGVGIGEAALGPAAYSILADSFPPAKRSRALSVYSMGVYVGAGLAILIGGLVTAALMTSPTIQLPIIGATRSWQATFFVVGLPGLVVALWILSLKEPERSGSYSATRGPTQSSLRTVVRFMKGHKKFFLCHFGGVCLLTLLFNAVSAWIPAYLQRQFGFGPREVALTYGPILLIAGSAGIVSGGWTSDWLRRRGHADAEMRTVLLSAVCVWPFALFATNAAEVTTSLALLALLLFFASFPFGAAIGALQVITPGPFRARVSAIYLMAVNLTGIGLGGTLTALVTDNLFHDEARIGSAMSLVAGIAAPVAALILWRGLAFYREAQLVGRE